MVYATRALELSFHHLENPCFCKWVLFEGRTGWDITFFIGMDWEISWFWVSVGNCGGSCDDEWISFLDSWQFFEEEGYYNGSRWNIEGEIDLDAREGVKWVDEQSRQKIISDSCTLKPLNKSKMLIFHNFLLADIGIHRNYNSWKPII